MSNLDTAIDVFNADLDRTPDEIDEAQLRVEVDMALQGLRSLGLVDHDT